jgi:hypothetical protein
VDIQKVVNPWRQKVKNRERALKEQIKKNRGIRMTDKNEKKGIWEKKHMKGRLLLLIHH